MFFHSKTCSAISFNPWFWQCGNWRHTKEKCDWLVNGEPIINYPNLLLAKPNQTGGLMLESFW